MVELQLNIDSGAGSESALSADDGPDICSIRHPENLERQEAGSTDPKAFTRV